MPNYSRTLLSGNQSQGAGVSASCCSECGALISPVGKRPRELHDAWHARTASRGDDEVEKEVTPVQLGDKLHGFCGGAFGRDSYGEKVVLAVGEDWVVAREGGRPIFAAVSPRELRALSMREGD